MSAASSGRLDPSRESETETEETDVADLYCSFGEAFIGPHPLCDAETVRMVADFEAAVARGEYTPRGDKVSR